VAVEDAMGLRAVAITVVATLAGWLWLGPAMAAAPALLLDDHFAEAPLVAHLEPARPPAEAGAVAFHWYRLRLEATSAAPNRMVLTLGKAPNHVFLLHDDGRTTPLAEFSLARLRDTAVTVPVRPGDVTTLLLGLPWPPGPHGRFDWLWLWEPDTYVSAIATSHGLIGAYLGALGLVIATSLVIGLFLPDRNYLLYALHVATLLVLHAYMLRVLDYALPTPLPPPPVVDVQKVLLGLVVCTMTLFSLSFLPVGRQPGYRRASFALYALAAAIIAVSLTPGASPLVDAVWGMPLLLGGCVALVLSAARASLATGYRPTRTYLVAWLPLLASLPVHVGAREGLLPTTALTEYSVQFGSGLEVLLFSLALADRIRGVWLERQAAIAASEAKTTFLAHMSHELRTPLNGVIGLTTLALRADPPPRQFEYLRKIDSSARTLLGVINNVLDFSKLEAGKVVLEQAEFSLDQVLERIADSLGVPAAEKGLELVFRVGPDVPRRLFGDALRLTQVLGNLAGNAVKFTAQGEVVVAIQRRDAADDAEAGLEFSVTDTGIGVPREALRKLFEPFLQADSSISRRYGGTGLGLSISRHLVEAMGGRLIADSRPGIGSVFRFTLTFAVPAQPAAPAFSGRTARVAATNDAVRTALTDMLSGLGFAVTADATTACDLVVTDQSLPDVTVPTLRLISALDAAVGDEPTTLAKPVTPATLEIAVRAALSGPATPTAPAIPHLGVRCHGRALVVDDHPINQQVAAELLEAAGLTVTIARSGREALAALEHAVFDLVFMDVQMPDIDGLEATRRIRSRPALAALPVIAMSAHAMASDRERFLSAGMNDHLGKPVDIARLREVLLRWGPGAEPWCVAEPPPARSGQGDPDIDAAAALARLGGDRALFLEMVRRLADDFAGFPRSLEAAQRVGGDPVAQLAHGLRGVAANVGATRLAEAAAMVEASPTAQACAVLLDRFEATLASAKALLRADPLPSGSSQPLAQLLAELEDWITEQRVVPPNRLDALRIAARNHHDRREVEALLSCVAALDYTRAREMLVKLRQRTEANDADA
jgi:signal transduction histidine kinase/CheY-like chemotaxis protein